MREVPFRQFLDQVTHLLEGLRRPDSEARDKEIDLLTSEVKALILMVEQGNEVLARAGLQMMRFRIEELVVTDNERPTDPMNL